MLIPFLAAHAVATTFAHRRHVNPDQHPDD